MKMMTFNTWSLRFLDEKAGAEFVKENLEDYREMYLSIIKNYCQDFISIYSDTFHINQHPDQRAKMFAQLPDSVLLNLKIRSSAILNGMRQLNSDKKHKIITTLISSEEKAQNAALQYSLWKILNLHKRTRLLLFTMGNTFLAMYFGFKFLTKGLMLLISYKLL